MKKNILKLVLVIFVVMIMSTSVFAKDNTPSGQPFQQISDEIEDLESDVEALNNDVGNLGDNVESFFDVFTSIAGLYEVDSFFDVFTELQTQNQQIETEIVALQLQSNNLQGQVDTIETEIVALQLQSNNLQGQIDTIETEIVALQLQSNNLQGQVDANTQNIDSFFDVFTDIAGLYEVDSFFDVFTEIKVGLDDLRTQVDSFFDVFVEVDVYEEETGDLQDQIDELQDKYDALLARVEALEECVECGCEDNSDCSLTDYCAKADNDCGGTGVCEEKPIACPDIWDPVCGCDGLTYANRCVASAAGVNVKHMGACPTGCTTNSDCTAGDYCAKADGDCDGTGECQPKPALCPDIWDPVCGCDGNTYGNVCEAAANGVNVESEGACPTECTTNSDCTAGDYCAKADGDCDGTGECQPKPELCPDIWDPVCGCEGTTYDNGCYAALAGVNVNYDGVCVVDCDDGNPCTDDTYDTVNYICVNTPNVGQTCNDGDACTESDVCDASGACTGTPIDCAPGYECQTGSCTDIDECLTAPCGLNAVCTNLPGTFECTCNPGYADCNEAYADGCERNTNNDENHCGSCGHVCDADYAYTQCSSGDCVITGCYSDYYDLDGLYSNGCECEEDSFEPNDACSSATNVGTLTDTDAPTELRTGNIMPGDSDWYYVLFEDDSDPIPNDFDIQVEFTSNPGNQFEFEVYRGGCPGVGTYLGTGTLLQVGGTFGTDDSYGYYFRVKKRYPSDSCLSYTIRFTNGVFTGFSGITISG